MARPKGTKDIEIWKPIDGFDGYEVSSFGKVRSYRKRGSRSAMYNEPRLIKSRPFKTHCKEYSKVNLMVGGAAKSALVHRLVAKAFIENTEDKPQVHHVDNDGLNNKVDNLDWVTNSENQLHRTDWRRPSGYKYVYKDRSMWRAYNKRLGFSKSFKTRRVAIAFAMQYY